MHYDRPEAGCEMRPEANGSGTCHNSTMSCDVLSEVYSRQAAAVSTLMIMPKSFFSVLVFASGTVPNACYRIMTNTYRVVATLSIYRSMIAF